ncbi:BadM/Rrf2 family transcriptional regulator [Alkalibaculum bacchi]|uniref:BadM/Rrf2 family transcriptional regulator n=1 Tax=Alkalibaculum bacchi TaxID=645887 RepID=A0A366I6T9_9FIRM|nr:Rrf2 family transcriptional regulator [Alkalibaculum bacchi]RBP64512.1 BadM/Rrf2 family transcriptional regulator [Alkalibaculum bacchi]
MKISTKGRYGLRAIIDLALNSNGEHVSLVNIAERQDISKNYLEQVFSTLRKADIVKSVKGAQGGYELAKDPSEITAGEILRALEGSLSVVNPSNENESNTIEKCIKKNVWNKIDESVNTVIDNTTLEDLINEYKKDSDVIMYYI